MLACHECDTLHELPALPPGGVARCRRCGYVLARNPRGGLDRPLALNLTALVLFVFANAFPFLTMDLSGREQVTTLLGASRGLYEAGMGDLAVVVFITTIVGPGAILFCNLYVLIGVRLGLRLPFINGVLAWLSHLVPWGMLDVFMLGVLVSFVKLAGMAEVIVGPALYAFTLLIFVLAAAMAALEPRVLWDRLGSWA